MGRHVALLPALIFIFATFSGFAQSSTADGIVTRYAGLPIPVDGTPAITQSIDSPSSVAQDGTGGFFVSSSSLSRVYHVGADGTITLIAGGGNVLGDGGLATSAQLSNPTRVVVDPSGNLLIADTDNLRIRKVTRAGLITTVAGNGIAGSSGDGGKASAAQLAYPKGLAVDAAGDIFIADTGNHRIREVTPDGVIRTVAGTTQGFSGDGGPASRAQFSFPWDVVVDPLGNLFIADQSNQRIRKITATGTISTIAGTGIAGFAGDGGPAVSAQIAFPSGVGLDADGGLLIADSNNSRIRKVGTDGFVSTIAGNAFPGFNGDGPAASASLSFPIDVAVDTNGDLLIADYNNARIRRMTNGVISTVGGIGYGFSGDGGPATSAQLYLPRGLTMDSSGNLYFADSANMRVRKITRGGIISTVAGSSKGGFSGDGGPATAARLLAPTAVAVDTRGNLYIADSGNYRVRKVTPAGIISTIAGVGSNGFSGDGGPATLAQIGSSYGITVDGSGNIFLGDFTSSRIRKITPDGVISTIAGTGTAGFSGDGGPATSAQLNLPWGISADSAGNILIADYSNFRIRKINSTTGIITTAAGNGSCCFAGDGGLATSARLGYPEAVVMDSAGNLFIADNGINRIREVTTDGVIRTVAGNGAGSISGDGGPATFAGIFAPRGLAVDPSGNLYISDSNNRVRLLSFRSQTSFAIADRGGMTLRSSGTLGTTVAGYGSIRPNSGSTTPAGLAIFGYSHNGVLVSEAGVPASPLIQNGRFYAEVNGPVDTGVAVANPNNQPAQVTFYFTGSSGSATAPLNITVPANGQLAAFLDQPPFTQPPLQVPSNFTGTFTFSSSVPVAVIALRGLTNERDEFLMTSLPVTNLDVPNAAGPVVFPHFADGGGWITQIVLVNPTDNVLTGAVQFLDPSGSPAMLTVNGQSNSTFGYSIPARSSLKLPTSGAGNSIQSGSVRLSPTAGVPPSGVAIFSERNGSVTMSESGVPGVPAGNAFRLYAETAGNFPLSGSIQSGIAIANLSNSPATVILEPSKLDGSSAGVQGALTIPSNGQTALFLNQVPGLDTLQAPFQGVLRVSSISSISVIGIRGRYNERAEFLMTTTPPVNETSAPFTAPLFFPHIVDSGGFTTQFILFSGQAGQSSSGLMQLFSTTGSPLRLTLQ